MRPGPRPRPLGWGLFHVKCCLAVIDSQGFPSLNRGRERWLLQVPALANLVLDLAPAISARWLGLFYAELTACGNRLHVCLGCPRDHLRWPSAQAPVVSNPRRGHYYNASGRKTLSPI